MAGVDLDVALEPAKRWYRVSGTYVLTIIRDRLL